MQIHLFATDVSGLDLIENLSNTDEVTAVIIPTNRLDSEKIERLAAEAERRGILTVYHRARMRLPDDLPPADAGISWLYSQIIQTDDLLRYPAGLLNMHGGQIPQYRGQSVLHWAIVNGDTEMGVTWHEIVEDVDAGPIWGETRIPIPPTATAAEMRVAMIEAGLDLFPSAWRAFASRQGEPRYPKLADGRVWPRRKPKDGYIEAGWPLRRLRDMVRASCPPWPTATFLHNGEILFVRAVQEHEALDTVPYKTADSEIVHLRIQERDN
jgi:methionyl-tRNA formyltransferase